MNRPAAAALSGLTAALSGRTAGPADGALARRPRAAIEAGLLDFTGRKGCAEKNDRADCRDVPRGAAR